MIPVNQPRFYGREIEYLTRAIQSGWIGSEGPFVKEFEERFAAKVGRRSGVAVSNGSAALEIAFKALGIGPGDEVILPTFTIISCAIPIVRLGATPVLVDSDPITWNMDIQQAISRITQKTKAILLVHTYGLPVDLQPLLEIAGSRGIRIVEDAAEMHGQTYHGKPCGSFGDLSIFSFYPNKLITTGEGGMIVTDDPKLLESCRSLRNLCFQAQRRYVHEELGWNYRFTNLQAAVGLAQLENFDWAVARKREIGSRYDRLLAHIQEIQLPLRKTGYAENIYWVFGIILRDDLPFDAAELMKRLKSRGVDSRAFFWPMHEQPVFQRMGLFAGERYPAAEGMARRGFYVPSGLALSDPEIESVVRALEAALHESV